MRSLADALADALRDVALDHSSPVPLYHQAALHLERMIQDGNVRPGQKLEGEVELADRFGVSRPTMRAALGVLVDKGLLVRRRGVGTVIASMPLTRPLALTSLHDDLIQAGRTPHTRVLAFEEARCPEEAREALGLDGKARTYVVRRLRFADEEPIALMWNVLPRTVGELDGGALEEGSLYRLLRRQGVRLHAARQRIGASAASDEQAALLEVDPGSPLVAVTRTSYDAEGVPLEYAHLLYPAHSYVVEMTLMVEH